MAQGTPCPPLRIAVGRGCAYGVIGRGLKVRVFGLFLKYAASLFMRFINLKYFRGTGNPSADGCQNSLAW